MKSEKSILIFGGGENQLSLIKTAQGLGVITIVIDPNKDAPAREISDFFEVVAPNDYEHTRTIAQKYNVDGIVTCQMENPLKLMARLAEDLGFTFPSQRIILQCRSKFLMKQAFMKNNIPCATGILIKEGEEVNSATIQKFNYPLIIKPVDAHSSRGVYKVKDFSELKEFEKQTRSFSSDNSYLIEEFVSGAEFSVESFTYKGKTTVIQITEKIVTPFPYTVEIGHIQPANLSIDDKKTIENITIRAINALEIDNCASHTELKLTPSGPTIIEIGARLGGDYITSHLVPLSTGINIEAAAINISMNIPPDISHFTNKAAVIQYLDLPAGKIIAKTEGWRTLLNLKYVKHALLTAKKGDIIPVVSDSAKRMGFVIVQADNRAEAINYANKTSMEIQKYLLSE